MFVFGINILAEEEVVWEEKFDRSGDLLELGWKQERKFDKDEFKVEDGRLKAMCAFNPYKGSLFSHTIPFIKRGYITFDVKSDGPSYNHLSLQFKLYNILTSYTGLAGGGWCRYYYDKEWRPKPDWKTVGKLPNKGRKWITYKIAFDNETGTMEFYIGDMDNPARLDSGVVLKPDKNGKGILKIGNYGLAGGTVLNEIDNIRLVKLSGKKKKAKIGNIAMLFRGIAFDYYQLDKIVETLNVSKSILLDLETYGAALTSKNQLRLNKKPHPAPTFLPKYIILADMPLGKVVPEYVQNIIVNSVKDGGTLLVLGGLFTLNKGEFNNTPIAKILPIEICSPWEIKELKNAEVINTTLPGKPMVKFLHPLKVKKEGQVLTEVNGNPFIVSGKCGKGKVVVCLGMPCGNFAPDETPFWEWSKWPEFIASKIIFPKGD